jgi:nicotinamidase-related amidase
MQNKTLLIIDIQNDYFEGGKNPLEGPMEAAMNAKVILDKFRESHLPVIFIQHLSTRPDSTFFIPGTTGAEIHHLLKPRENEKIIEKHFPNSFIETNLYEYLKILGTTDLVICGMMTHMCVDATVRAAKDFGFNCTLIGNACATKDLEILSEKVEAFQVHHAFLAALNYFYAKVTDTINYLSEH